MKRYTKLLSLPLVFVLTSCGFFSNSKGYASGKTVEGTKIKYSFSLDEKQKVLDCLDETLRLAEEGENFKAFEASYNKMNDYYNKVVDAYKAEMLRYYMYGKEENQELQLKFYELMMEIVNKSTKIHYIVLDNDFKRSFYGDMPDEDIIKEIGPNYPDEYYEKKTKSEELESEYNNLDPDSATFNSDVNRIYVEFVKNQNEMAVLAGYDNFLDYSYENYYYRPYKYGVTDDYFTNIKTYALPYFNRLYSDLTDDIAALSKDDLNDVRTFVLKNGFTTNFSLIEDYKDYYGGEFKTIFNDLWYESKSYYISYEDDATEAAFTSSRNGKPFVYFGKRYEATTIMHEFGHYYDAVINNDGTLCFDLAETQSQSNELLFVNYLKEANKFSNAACDVIINNQAIEMIYSVLVGAMVNEFEKKAYLDEDLTEAELDKYAKEVYQAVPIDDFDFDYYWRMVTIQSPGYYISYSTSAVGALEIGNVAKTDLRGAIDKYEKVINYNKEHADNYLLVLTDAGLSSPFNESTFKTIFK